MRVAVVGSSGHAGWHYSNLLNDPRIESVFCFHPHKPIPPLHNLEDLLDFDCLIISSPNTTHHHYISFLVAHKYCGSVYLEKPAFCSPSHQSDILRLYNLGCNIMVGYHMPFTNAFEFVRKYLNNAKVDVLKILLMFVLESPLTMTFQMVGGVKILCPSVLQV